MYKLTLEPVKAPEQIDAVAQLAGQIWRKEQTVDIGNGYVMDDFVMERKVS